MDSDKNQEAELMTAKKYMQSDDNSSDQVSSHQDAGKHTLVRKSTLPIEDSMIV